MNVKKEDLEHILSEEKIDQNQTKRIIDKIVETTKTQQEEKEARPKKVLRGLHLVGDEYPDPSSIPYNEGQVFILKQDEDEDPNQIVKQLTIVAAKHNRGKKSKKDPCFTVTDVFSKATKANLREEGILFQGETVLHIIDIENTLPLDSIEENGD
jgi:hypothetical protein